MEDKYEIYFYHVRVSFKQMPRNCMGFFRSELHGLTIGMLLNMGVLSLLSIVHTEGPNIE